MSFEAGMKMASDAIEGISVRKDRRSQQRLRRAQGKVLREEAKEKKAEREAREKHGYYETKKTQLTPEQRAEIDEARRTNPKRAKELEEAYLGPLSGGFISKEKAEIKSARAAAQSAKQDALKKKLANKLQSKVQGHLSDPDYDRLAEASVQQQEAAPKLTLAEAELKSKMAADYEAESNHRRAMAEKNAESARIQAHSQMVQATVDMGELSLKVSEFDAKRTMAENAAKQKNSFEEAATKFNEVLAAGPQSGESYRDFHTRISGMLDKVTSYTGGINVVSDHITARRTELSQRVDAWFKREKESGRWAVKKENDVINSIARTSVEELGYSEELKKAQTRDGIYGENDILTRHYLLQDAKRSGIPLTYLDEENPDSKRIFRYNKNPNREFKTHIEDGQEKLLLDGAGNPIPNKLLDMTTTIAAWDDFKRKWISEHGSVRMEKSVNNTTGTGGTGGQLFPDPNTPPQPTSSESIRSTLVTDSPYNLSGVPVTQSELIPAAEADKIYEFLNGMVGSSNPLVYPIKPVLEPDGTIVTTDPDSIKVTGGEIPKLPQRKDDLEMEANRTDALGTEGLRPEEVKPRYYTDPESTGGMIERGVTTLEKLREEEREVKRQTDGDFSDGANAARKRAANRVKEAKEATEILEVREFASKYIDRDDQFVDGDRVYLKLNVPDEIKKAAEGLKKSSFGVTISASRATPENLIKRRLFELTGNMGYGRFEGLGLTKTVGHGYQDRVTKSHSKLMADSKIKIPKGASASSAKALADKRDKAIDRLKRMKQEEEKLSGLLDVLNKLDNLRDSFGESLSVKDARKYGIIK